MYWCLIFIANILPPPEKVIAEIYTKNYKLDALNGRIITKREFRRVTSRYKLCIFIKHEYFEELFVLYSNMG